MMSSAMQHLFSNPARHTLLRGATLVCLVWCATGLATATDTGVGKENVASPRKTSPYATGGMPATAKFTYAQTYGVDGMYAKLAESGQLVRFSYRVTDSAKAAPLGDKVSTPMLLDEEVHAVLQVPQMEKVGQLRQTGSQEVGKSYWMVFSNKGNLVKVGHRVSVVIGQFRVDGLVVQ